MARFARDRVWTQAETARLCPATPSSEPALRSRHGVARSAVPPQRCAHLAPLGAGIGPIQSALPVLGAEPPPFGLRHHLWVWRRQLVGLGKDRVEPRAMIRVVRFQHFSSNYSTQDSRTTPLHILPQRPLDTSEYGQHTGKSNSVMICLTGQINLQLCLSVTCEHIIAQVLMVYVFEHS
jgi:hypothetical protein